MAQTSALLTLEQVVTRYLLKFKRPTEDAITYTEHAANCVRDWNLYNGNKVTTAKVSIDANYVIEMPTDFIGFVDLCWYFKGRYWSFTRQRNLVRTVTEVGDVESRDEDYEEGQPIAQPVTYGYGARGGVNAYNYTIDWAERRIIVMGVYSDTAILMYTGSGVEVGSDTYVSDLITPVIDTYLLYMETFWITNFVREREMRRKAYNEEVAKARNFINSLSYNELRDLILNGATQGLNR